MICKFVLQSVEKKRIVLCILLNLCLGMGVFIDARIREMFFNKLSNMQEAAPYMVAFLMFVLLYQYLLPNINSRNEISMRIAAEKYTEEILAHEIAVKEYETMESSRFRDSVNKVLEDKSILYNMISDSIMLGRYMLSMTVIFLYLSQIGIAMTAAMFIIFIPVAVIGLKSGAGYSQVWDKTAGLKRKAEYLNTICLDKEYAEERSVYSYISYIQQRWEKLYRYIRKATVREEFKGAVRMQAGGLLIYLYLGLSLLAMVYYWSRGSITIGYIISYLSLFPSLCMDLFQNQGRRIVKIVNNTMIVKSFLEFYAENDDESNLKGPQIPEEFRDIVFDHVWFKYPDTETYILKDVSFRFEKQKKYAIVGRNGMGKSTIYKLLLGLYRPTKGEIYCNGRSAASMSAAEKQGFVCGLSQDFARYHLSLRDNISMGDPGRQRDTEKITDALKAVMMDGAVSKRSRKIDTVIGKEHNDSTELSGGEWQKVAIARLMLSDAKVKILDEPTAAIDPESEREINIILKERLEAETVIMITHRLDGIKDMDEIIVVEGGKIIGSGTHEELTGCCPVYSEMISHQRKMYMLGE